MSGMGDADELVQIAERALADAEQLLRQAPTEANQRRVISAWAFVRRSRQAAHHAGREAGEAPANEGQ
jgi:hypothetical protein